MEENFEYMLKIDVKTSQAISDLNKSRSLLADSKDLDKKLSKYIMTKELDERTTTDDINQLKFNDKNMADKITKIYKTLEKNVADVKSFSMTKVKMNEIAQSQGQFKEFMEKFLMT